MKLARRYVKPLLNAFSINDKAGAAYTQPVISAITSITFFLEGHEEEIDKFYKKIEEEGITVLEIPKNPADRSQEQMISLNDYIDNHEEFNKFLDTTITIATFPIKLSDWKKCRIYPTFFRGLNHIFLVNDEIKGSKKEKVIERKSPSKAES